MKTIKIKKGHNLKISGIPKNEILNVSESNYVTFHPARFKSFKTKLLIKENEYVKVGTPIFFDKNNSEVMFVSTVSGNVKEIIYGGRRSVESIVIENDKKYELFILQTDKSKETLLKSGLWSLIRQKPFSKIPDSKSMPKSFFISSVPTEPFAVDNNFLFKNIDNHLQMGIDVLKEIFSCDVNMGISDNSEFSQLKNINFYKINTLHPVGNVGVQIHHIDPIKSSDDTRWYLSMQDLNRIGYYFENNKHFNYKYYSVGGNGVLNASYYKTLIGTSIKEIADFSNKDIRFISGDVLSGCEILKHNSIDYFDEILSVIEVSKKREFLGWLKPGISKYSLTKTFLSKIISNNKSKLNTHLNGSIRTIIPMGNWESVLPMNIYPEYLVKSILCKDIDMMEKLGIYESSPEDFALCSFICQSKVEVSKIIQDGLDLIVEEV